MRGGGLLGVPVGGGPPARRPRRELRSARRLEARPGPAAAHGHRGQVLRTLRLPPHRRCLCRLEARPGPAAAHGHRSQVLRSLRRHGRSLWRPCLAVLLLVVPLVFRAPRGLSRGPGCLVRPWAAARPLAVRAASLRLGASSRGAPWPCRHPRAPQPGSPVPPVASTPVGPVVLRTIRLVSRPALALPPPTSTAAWPRHRPRVPWQVPRPLWHRDQARRSLRRSPVVCVFWIGSSVVDRNGASG